MPQTWRRQFVRTVTIYRRSGGVHWALHLDGSQDGSGCRARATRAAEIAVLDHLRRKLDLWRVGDAVPVAMLAHGLDECGDVERERPVRRVVGWQAGFGQHAFAGSDC
jgi:hypothetical protein